MKIDLGAPTDIFAYAQQTGALLRMALLADRAG